MNNEKVDKFIEGMVGEEGIEIHEKTLALYASVGHIIGAALRKLSKDLHDLDLRIDGDSKEKKWFFSQHTSSNQADALKDGFINGISNSTPFDVGESKALLISDEYVSSIPLGMVVSDVVGSFCEGIFDKNGIDRPQKTSVS